jgi:hypothetical protein
MAWIKPMNEKMQELCERITNYLWCGGLFNPELADHIKVRDLLIDCRKVMNEVVTSETNTN